MRIYTNEIKSKAIELRHKGKTGHEINYLLNQEIPKSTFTGWFKGIKLSFKQQNRIAKQNAKKLDLARQTAVKVNMAKRSSFLKSLDDINESVSRKIEDRETAKIALSMLCLGEASKYGSGGAFYLGSSSPKIIVLFIKLLKRCFEIDSSKFRFTIQCRSDQNIEELERFWRKVTGVTSGQFYKTRPDLRTVGKPTKNIDYKGVLRVDYFDSKIQLELESLANLLYNQAASL
jgi:hypothetical protein